MGRNLKRMNHIENKMRNIKRFKNDLKSLQKHLNFLITDLRFTLKHLDLFKVSIRHLNLDVRPTNCLIYYGIKTVGDLLNYSGKEIGSIKNIGHQARWDIAQALGDMGLELKDETK